MRSLISLLGPLIFAKRMWFLETAFGAVTNQRRPVLRIEWAQITTPSARNRSTLRTWLLLKVSTPVSEKGISTHIGTVQYFIVYRITNSYVPLYYRCPSGNTDSFKEKHTSIRPKKGHLVAIPGIISDERSSSESLTFGKSHGTYLWYLPISKCYKQCIS